MVSNYPNLEQRKSGTTTVDLTKGVVWTIHRGNRYSTGNLEQFGSEENKGNGLDMLIRYFSPEETEDDTVDIHIDDRLGICIMKEKFGAALGYNYITCHHGLTIFVTAPRGAEGSTKQQLVNDTHPLETTKTIADVERRRGKHYK